MFSVGDEVLWLYTAPRGWHWAYRVPAVVVKVNPKQIVIAAELKRGGVKRVSVRAETLVLAKQQWSDAWQAMICQG